MKKLLYPPSDHLRPVYLQTREVLSPNHRVTDILRSDTWTLVTVHPGAEPTLVASEIPRILDPTNELLTWIRGFTNRPIDLQALRRDPLTTLAALDPRLPHVPCYPHYIPRSLRGPWAKL